MEFDRKVTPTSGTACEALLQELGVRIMIYAVLKPHSLRQLA